MATVGQSVTRIDAEGKATGATKYGGDLYEKGMLHAKVLRSKHAFADVTMLDISAAEKASGVVGIYTAKDVGGTNKTGLIARDQEVLASKQVRYMGDALAVVLAETEAEALAAVKQITVEYNPRPAIHTIDQALAPDAPKIHEYGNLMGGKRIRKGDAEQVLDNECDVVVEETFQTQTVDHAFLDVEAGCAWFDPADSMLTIEVSGQWVHEERRLTALALGLPIEKVRIIQPATGGAFGGREDISIQMYLGIAALKNPGQKIYMRYTRSESMVARHKRHAIRCHYVMGAKNDGTLCAAKITVWSDEGAYASTGIAVMRKASSHSTGPYRVPNVSVDVYGVHTNNNPTGAMRGFGAAQMAIAYEGMMDRLAVKLGMDRYEIRFKNLLHSGEGVTTTQIIPLVTARECMDAALVQWARGRKVGDGPILPMREAACESSSTCAAESPGQPDGAHSKTHMYPDPNPVPRTQGALDGGTGILPVAFKPVNPWKAPELAEGHRNLPHLVVPDSTYFITFCTADKLILNDSARDVVMSAVRHWDGSHIQLHAAVVMPDHVHFIARILDGSTPEKLLHSIKSFSANQINQLLGRTGSVWQDEYFDHIVRDLSELAEKTDYVRTNPDRRGLLRSPDDSYKWVWVNEHRQDACATNHGSTPFDESASTWLAAKHIWDQRSYETDSPWLKRGYGISVFCFGLGYGDGFPDASRARVLFNEKGELEVYSGAVEVGQGLLNMIAQVSAEEVGVPLERVKVIAADTLLTPESGSSSATRQTYFTGSAVKIACSELREHLLDVAENRLGVHPLEVKVENGIAYEAARPENRVTIDEILAEARRRGIKMEANALFKPRTVEENPATGLSPRAFITYLFGAHIAQVLVDTETGQVKIERYIACHDVGRAINPAQVEGQIQGGVAQGIGMAIMEEVLMSQEGRMLNAGFTDYIIPSASDVPDVEAVILEHDDPGGPFGARGVGEPPLIGTSPAICGAILDALKFPVAETPVTSERLWRLINAHGGADAKVESPAAAGVS